MLCVYATKEGDHAMHVCNPGRRPCYACMIPRKETMLCVYVTQEGDHAMCVCNQGRRPCYACMQPRLEMLQPRKEAML